MSNPIVESIIVFLDTGLQKRFVPLRKPLNYTDLPDDKIPQSLQDALEKIEQYDAVFTDETKKLLDEMFSGSAKRDWNTFAPFLKARFGEKVWHFKNGSSTSLNGIWFMVETNTSGQDGNKGATRYDRGYFYRSNNFTEEEKNKFREEHENGVPHPGGSTSPYINLQQGTRFPLEICYHDHNTDSDVKIDFGTLSFELVIRVPGGETRDVDVVLDLGNTRTAGLLFDHNGDTAFAPLNFKKAFKVLRLKPDPASGEYNLLDDVESGIAESWFVIHQLEHQKYLGPQDPKEPALLEVEYKDLDVKPKTSGFWPFNKTEYEISGRVCQRIPQMFTHLSPILLGDQAERAFNLSYARAMIAVGANLQQSSPKRYYWDDNKSKVWWSMLQNEWDKTYSASPENAAALPMLQGEMLRFMPEDGSILDLSKDREPVDTPNAYPQQPAYPKQSTLTWFLLHILERAYAQSNSAFQAGANFIPHRLRKVLITYPSGWTNDEIARYRERCQEALDIFSQANIYHGVKSPLRLEMVASEQTPDEAVAGQLPFVFSEIIRYPGQTAAKWISLVGKKREGKDTVRIMNFDIGGGTSDISVVEYQDRNDPGSGILMNLLSATLLFKDGQTIAGDDLVREIIEKIILDGLRRSKKTIPGLADNIVKRFTQVFNNPQDEAIRSRIVRTCLIPLATECLSRQGNESVEFSAREAGINENNWDEFLEFIEVPDDAKANVGIEDTSFSFNNTDINKLIENRFAGLFRNCAMYAAAYDVDMLIFSGKPSELPYIQTMAKRYIPIDEGRIIFARGFKAGHWYPFTDDKGYIKDAKTVTVVGAALFYALSNGLISGWKIETTKNITERNEWGQLAAMKGSERAAFLPKREMEVEVPLLPGTIIARRQNICSSPEPVYMFLRKKQDVSYEPVKVRLKRNTTNDGESLTIESIDGSAENVGNYELKLWPCDTANGISFWQDVGIFNFKDAEI